MIITNTNETDFDINALISKKEIIINKRMSSIIRVSNLPAENEKN